MNIIKHFLFALLLDAGVALAFVHHDSAPESTSALPLCPPPDSAGTYFSADADSRLTRTTTDHDHENK